MGEGQALSSTAVFLGHNLISIVFFIILTFVAWKICKKAELNPFLSLLVFVLAIFNQGAGFLIFILISIIAVFKIIKAKKP
jgi:hypothetical protein